MGNSGMRRFRWRLIANTLGIMVAIGGFIYAVSLIGKGGNKPENIALAIVFCSMVIVTGIYTRVASNGFKNWDQLTAYQKQLAYISFLVGAAPFVFVAAAMVFGLGSLADYYERRYGYRRKNR